MKKYYLIIGILILAAVLRLTFLDKFPAGLNADEAAIGYNAWSLLQTGKDEHSIAWPLVFRSFDDYKLPVYFYLVLPFVKFLGLTVTAVRLPSALLGIASVLLVYLIIKLLFPPVIARSERDVAISRHLPLLSALFLALSPWHLQFSRGGWEVNAATFFILLSLIFLLKSFEKISYLFLFGIFTALSLYTYHSARVIAPVLFIAVSAIYFAEIKKLFFKKNLKTTLMALILSLILILPIISQLLSKEGQSRFSGVSIFADSGPDWQATNYRLEHEDKSSLQVRLIHNRYLSYSMRFVQNYLSHYSPDFLFLNGDAIARSKVPETGQSLLFLLPFFALGLLSLIMLDSNGKKVVLAWFLIAPLAASITYQSPHALRAENMSVPLMIIAALGTYEFFELIKKYKFVYKILIFCIFGFLSFYSFARYLHMYYVHYPKELPYAWQYGFDQVAAFTKENYNKYDHIIITDRYDQPYILIAFFTKYPPADLQRDIVMSEPDHYGFATGRKLGKYEFRTINYEQDKLLPNTLLITAEEKVDDTKVIGTVLSPAGAIMFKFLSTK